MSTAFRAVVAYLSDWKNLVSHAAVGIGLVIVTIFLPLPLIARLGVLAAVIVLNIARTKLGRGRQAGADGELLALQK